MKAIVPNVSDTQCFGEKSVVTEESWRFRFWSIFVGQGISLVGSSITQFVLLWWITDTTGSASALGAAGLAAMLPQALLGPFGGVFADRHNRQLIMMLSDLISAVCVLMLIIQFEYGEARLTHVYAIMAIRSAMQAFQMPASMASVAMLVPPEFIPRVTGMNQIIQGLTMIGAAPLGALVISVLPLKYALGIDVFTAVFGIVPLLFVTVPQLGEGKKGRKAKILTQMKEGVLRVWLDEGLRGLYILIVSAAFFVMPLVTMIPLLVKVHFHGDASRLALFESLFGFGSIVGGGVYAAIAPKRRIPCVLGGLALCCLGLAVASIMPAELYLVSGGLWFLSASANTIGNAAFVALLQTVVPNDFQGRAISLMTTMASIAAPAGLAVATPLGEMVGVQVLFVGMSLCAFFVMLSGFLFSGMRDLDRRSDG